jgi:hypothetical protein
MKFNFKKLLLYFKIKPYVHELVMNQWLMTAIADLNDSTELLFTVALFRAGRLSQFRIVQGKNYCCPSCKRVRGIWYERERERVHLLGESNWWHEFVCFGELY